MLIRCPTCSSVYDLPPDRIDEAGGRVHCARCRESWSVTTSRAAGPTRDTARHPHHGPEIVAEARSARRSPTTEASRRPVEAKALAPARTPMRRGTLGAAVLLGIAISAMTAVARKEALVRLYPSAAALFDTIGLPVNLRGLALADVHGSIAAQPNGTILTLRGEIRNLRPGTVAVPPLRIAVRDKASNELYSWTAAAPKPKLDAGETVAFRSRLAAPPEGGQDLVVSFADPIGAPQGSTERP